MSPIPRISAFSISSPSSSSHLILFAFNPTCTSQISPPPCSLPAVPASLPPLRKYKTSQRGKFSRSVMASSSKSTASALTVAGITVATGLLAYAVYFDYKRRNDAAFRKKLRP